MKKEKFKAKQEDIIRVNY